MSANNSDTRDAKYTGRFAYTPRGEDQYVFSYINQKGEKGVPLYAGLNSGATFNNLCLSTGIHTGTRPAYYLITNTGLGESSSIKLRAYYDEFPNEMDFYDNASFSTMNKTTSNHSFYNDHSAGASAEFTTRALSTEPAQRLLLFQGRQSQGNSRVSGEVALSLTSHPRRSTGLRCFPWDSRT